MTKEKEHDVGFGNPPKHTRFKPGQSGNPRGRPKGSRNLKTDVVETLKAPVQIKKDGKSKKVTTQQAALLRLREKALGGDQRALDKMLGLAHTYNDEEVASDAGAALFPAQDSILARHDAKILKDHGIEPAAAKMPKETDDDEGWLK